MFNNLKFTSDLIGSSSYLVATASGGSGIIGYQLQMLTNCKIGGILPASQRQNNDDLQIYYNVTGKLSMKQILARSKVSEEMFVCLGKAAIAAFKELEEYQLASGGIALDENLIFYRAGGVIPEFIYLPVTTEDSGFNSLKKFLLDLIVHGNMDTVSGNFIQNMLNTLNEPNLTADGLLKALDGNETQVIREEKKVYKNPFERDKTETDFHHEELLSKREEFVPPVRKEEKPQEIIQSVINDIKMPPVEVKTEPKAASKNKVIFAGVQAVIVAAAVAAYMAKLFFNDGGGIELTNVGVFLIAAAGLDFVLFRELLVNSKNRGKEVNTAPPVNDVVKSLDLSGIGQQSKPYEEQRSEERISNQPIHGSAANDARVAVKEQKQVIHLQEQPMQDSMFGGFDVDDTVVDGAPMAFSSSSKNAHLEYVDNGSIVKVYFDRTSIIVGRLRNQVDCVLNSKRVGKVHCEFIKKGDDYFVKDYNSTNGTFINSVGQRIRPNMEYPIKDGDRIYVADVELLFRK